MLEDAAADVFADREDIRVSAEAQVAGDVRLRECQQFGVVGQPRTRTLAPAQHAKAGGRFIARHAPVVYWTTLIAQQREMAAGQPAQQRGYVATARPRVATVRVGLHVVGQVVE